MVKHRMFILGMTLLAGLVTPAAALAQTSPATLPVSVGQKVAITVRDGRVINGTVKGLGAEVFELQEARIPVADINLIRLRDSPWDGFGKGAAIGLLIGGGIGLLGDSTTFNTTENQSYALAGAEIGIVSGALLGLAFDAAKSRTVYRRIGGAVVSVHPVVSNAGKGLGVSMRW